MNCFRLYSGIYGIAGTYNGNTKLVVATYDVSELLYKQNKILYIMDVV